MFEKYKLSFFKFNFAFDLYLENAKRYKIRNKKLLKLPRGGGAKTAQGSANFLRFAHFIALRAIFVPKF